MFPVISEIKVRSKKEGDLLHGRDPVLLAQEMAGCPVAGISVVTEPEHFGAAALHTSVSDYNVARADIYYRSGRLLDYDNVWLQEGPWNSDAGEDVERHARARANAFPGIGLKTAPEPLTE